MGNVLRMSSVCLLVILACERGYADSPYAVEVIASFQGTDPTAGYDDPAAVVGSPARTTTTWGETYPSDVTMFNPAWGYYDEDQGENIGNWDSDQLYSMGAGGSVTVRFDHPVLDDPANPYGLDLLVFGNAGFWDSDWPNGVVLDILEGGHALVEISQDGASWYEVPDVPVDYMWPNQGYTDTSSPYGLDGQTPSDFTKPCNPDLTVDGLVGKTYAQMLAIYDGAGGGTGLDIASAIDTLGDPVALDWIQYVRLSVSETATISVDIDGFADVTVPEPTSLALLMGLGAMFMRGKRRS